MMFPSKLYIQTTALIIAFALPLAGPAPAQESIIKLGMLSCTVEGGFGLLLGSTRDIACTFNPARGGKTEFYDGTINKLGVYAYLKKLEAKGVDTGVKL